MKRLNKGLAAAVIALAVGSLAAGCGGSGPVSGAVSSAASAARSAASSLRPSGSASVSLPTSAPTPTAQAPVTSQAPAPTTAAAASPAAGGSGSSLLWLWIALAALVVIGLIVWIARASGRRSAAAAGWRSAVIDTYAKGQALADAVRIADRPGAPPAAGAGSAGLQARADELSRELYRLREGARDEEDRMRVDDTLTSLRGLRSAMADEQAAGGAGGPGSPEAAQVRGRLMSFEESLRALRAPYEQMPRI
jgi:hypothetical protein